MAIFSNTGFYGFLSSCKKKGEGYMSNFVSGFTGSGWKIWEYVTGKYKLEIDSLTVRETMTVFELLIQKIRAVKGALTITQASGKIKDAFLSEDKLNWMITIEDEMSFVAHDIIRCQKWDSGHLKGYWVEIDRITKNEEGEDVIVIPASEFCGNIGYDEDGLDHFQESLNETSVPAIGDEIVQFGNSELPNRQSAIYLHADEGGQPAIDLLFGVCSKSFSGCVKTRIGGNIPGTDGLKGFYCENGMIKSTDATGKVVYQLSPDGSFSLGRGQITYDSSTDELILGSEVTLSWDNLSPEAQEKLKGEKGDPGIAGSSPYLIDLSNENLSIPCEYNGNVVGTIPAIYATVYHGAEIDRTWTFSAARNDCSGTSAVTDGVLGVSIWTLDADVATVIVTASKKGFRDLVATCTLTKVKAGSPGEDAVVYWLDPSVTVIKKDKNGNLLPSTVSCVKMKQIGNGTASVTSDKTLKYQLSTGEITPYTSAVAIGSAKWLDFILYEGTTVLDRERIPVIQDGTDGPQGVPGAPGEDGKTTYTWIRYADSVMGEGMSNDPVGKSYIGLAYNKSSQAEGTDPSVYTWSRLKGEDGTDGVPGAPGKDGKTLYTWIAYSDYPDGRNMYQIPTDQTKYIGISVNQETETEGTDPQKYAWSKFRGNDGSDAELPEWLEEWNGYASSLGGDYIVTPKMFSGKKDSVTNKLTGIAQGKDCMTIDGIKRTGIFALVDDEVMFELDPVSGRHSFKGKVETNSSGNRIVLDPESRSLELLDINDRSVGRFQSFVDENNGDSAGLLFVDSYYPNGDSCSTINLMFGVISIFSDNREVFRIGVGNPLRINRDLLKKSTDILYLDDIYYEQDGTLKIKL